MIDRYEKEMRKIFESTPKPVPVVMAASAPAEISGKAIETPPEKPAPIPENREGKIMAWITSGRGAVPLSGVTVVFSVTDEDDPKGRQKLLAVEETDSSGKTPAVSVITAERELSLEPGSTEPFSTVYISAAAKGFAPVRERPADVFAGEISIQKIDLIPNPEKIRMKEGEQKW